MFPCKFLTTFSQLDVFAFQSLILYPKRIVLSLELLIRCAQLGKILILAFSMMGLR